MPAAADLSHARPAALAQNPRVGRASGADRRDRFSGHLLVAAEPRLADVLVSIGSVSGRPLYVAVTFNVYGATSLQIPAGLTAFQGPWNVPGHAPFRRGSRRSPPRRPPRSLHHELNLWPAGLGKDFSRT
jgi:hypothetical protein